MCGLLGFIGISTNKTASESLVNELFKNTRYRGIDASGFYCVSSFDQKKIFYYKQAGPSTDIVLHSKYKKIWQNDLSLGLFHCRATSPNSGPACHNENNHPFVSHDYKKAIIHNGMISDKEFKKLKNGLELVSKCDSEIILRFLENKKQAITSITKLIDEIEKSYYAIAFSEITAKERSLYLFRNLHRPLYLADFRNDLGQYFFFSTLDILNESLRTLQKNGIKINPTIVVEIEPSQIIQLILKENEEIILKKFIYKKDFLLNEKKLFEISNPNQLTSSNEEELVFKEITDIMYLNIKLEKQIRSFIFSKIFNQEKKKMLIEKINEIKKIYQKISNI
jgi:glucosamine 6-phosphate synthetase-like amidotransferase/phosphosugar isomerase protein